MSPRISPAGSRNRPSRFAWRPPRARPSTHERTLTMSTHDFDFLAGSWKVRHRRLKERLKGCTEWDTFGGTSTLRQIMDGHGNVDVNDIELPSGTYRAA